MKPLYGKQEGAVISYNPTKPGHPSHPSHTYHTCLMAGLRQVLGVEVHAGNEHAARHTQPELLNILDGLPEARKLELVRGDCAFGLDTLMTALEERQQPYLFKLKLSKNVKCHIGRLFRENDWSDAGQGWEGKDGTLMIAGWAEARRVVVLRRPIQGEVVLAGEDNGQQLLGFIEAGQRDGKQTGQHADFGKARAALMHVSALLQGWVVRATEQLNHTTVWNLVCDHIKRVIASIGPPQNFRLLANLAGGDG